jgi:hypothetical protein
MTASRFRFFWLGTAVAALATLSLGALVGLGVWSWDHRWPGILGAGAVLALLVFGLNRLQTLSLTLSDKERFRAALWAAVVATTAIQGFFWSQRQLTEAFRDYAMVVGVTLAQGQMEVNRVLLSLTLSCFGTGVLLLAFDSWRQRRWFPQEEGRLSLAAVCLVMGLAAAAFLAGRGRALMSLG